MLIKLRKYMKLGLISVKLRVIKHFRYKIDAI